MGPEYNRCHPGEVVDELRGAGVLAVGRRITGQELVEVVERALGDLLGRALILLRDQRRYLAADRDAGDRLRRTHLRS